MVEKVIKAINEIIESNSDKKAVGAVYLKSKGSGDYSVGVQFEHGEDGFSDSVYRNIGKEGDD